MEERTIIKIFYYLGKGAGTSFVIYLILRFIKNLHPYFETWKNNDTKLKEIQSNERIEKMKLKTNRKKGKAN